jgi:hypothetical protein
MKYAIAMALMLAAVLPASAQYFGNRSGSSSGLYDLGTGSNSRSHYVAPSIDSSGNFRSGHHQTNPNNTQLDNFSTRGNYNPYTGSYGTRRPRY